MLTPRFVDALALAFELHERQYRKQTLIPYVSHLMAVSALVLEDGGSEDEAIAALLHDAVEDQGGAPTLARIRERFGEQVAGIVAACTDTDTTPKPPWRARKEKYVDHLRAEDRVEVLRVVAADKLHNARAVLADYRHLAEDLWSRFSGGRDGTLWYYREVCAAVQASGRVPNLAAELERTVGELERLAAR